MPPTKFNARTRQIVLEAIARGNSIRTAAGLAGVGHATVSDWIAQKPLFANAVEKARAGYIDKLVAIVTAGAVTAEDTRLAAQILRAKDAEGWAESTRHEITGPGGGPVVHEVTLRWPDGPTPPAESAS